LNEAPWRRNYNFAHEIFHLITWDSFPPSLIKKKPDLWDMLEKIVNVFASCILLPSDVVTVEVEKNIDKDSIAYIDLIGMAIKTAKVMMLKCVLLVPTLSLNLNSVQVTALQSRHLP
jgi:Zn-dependent peptidase ImmA (M78 family)